MLRGRTARPACLPPADRIQGQLQRGHGHNIIMSSQQRERKLETVLIPYSRCSYSPPARPPKMHYGKKSTHYRGSEFSSYNLIPRCKHCPPMCVASGKRWCVEGTIREALGAPEEPCFGCSGPQHRHWKVETFRTCMVCSLQGFQVCKCVLINFCLSDGQ